jgi:hypothetical protein
MWRCRLTTPASRLFPEPDGSISSGVEHHERSGMNRPTSSATGYEIRIQGRLDPRWTARFDGLSIRHDVDGTTVLSGLVTDQAALHGLLSQIRDLALPLIGVTQVDAGYEGDSI